jgi:parvulin-like peptidyl-prolyl isomerase
MTAWRRHSHRLFAFALGAFHVTFGGCQAKEVRAPANPPPPNDFVTLTSMAGNEVTQRGQKEDRAILPSVLEIRSNDPGSKEYRSARIRAIVNGDAILDEEVQAAAFQQLVGVKSEAEKAEILNAKLTEIIEREVLLQDAWAKLTGKGKVLKELQNYAEKEFERQWLHKMMRANKMEDEEEFKKFMRNAGMPVEMIRRQWVRNLIAMEYVRSRIEPTLNKVGHLEVVEYYEKHPNEFRIEDSLVWQDLFIAKARHASPQAARQFADALLTRIRNGEDFARLAKEFDNGDSSLRENAEGAGRTRGEIKPPEAEPVLWSMKAGQAALIELEFGYHIVKVKEREYAGVKPFDDKVQKEIKDKVKNQIFMTEMKQIVNHLKRQAVIEVATEIK